MLSVTPNSRTGLKDLSMDVVRHITTFLSLKSFFNLQSTCRVFQQLAYNGCNYPSYNQFMFLFELSKNRKAAERSRKLDQLMAAMVRKGQIRRTTITEPILSACVYFQHFELFKALVDFGMEKIKMQFLLCEVVTQAQLEMVELLVVKIVDLEATDLLALSGNKYATPVITALTKGEAGILALLLKNGADAEKIDPLTDKTPLMRAARRTVTDCCNVLLDNGASVNAVNQAGCSALFYSRNITVFRYLINHGAAIDIKDSAGSTMLHFTVEMKKLQLYLELLRLGIDSTIRNMKGFTAFDMLKINYKSVKGLDFKSLSELDIVLELIKRKF